MKRFVLFALLLAAATVTRAEAPWDAELIADGTPAKAAPGERLLVTITLANRGSESWDPARDFAVAGHWFDEHGEVVAWDGERTPLAGTVPPGGETTLTAAITVPDVEGALGLQWDVVEEHVLWVSRRDPTPVEISPVQVTRPQQPAAAGSRETCPMAWAALILTCGLAVLAWAGRRGRGRGVAARADLIWLVVAVPLAERAVVVGDPSAWVVSLVCFAAAAGLINLLPGRVRPWVGWAIGASAVALFVLDRLYLRFFFDLPSVGTLAEAGQAGEIAASVRSLLTVCDGLLAATAVGGAVVALGASRAGAGRGRGVRGRLGVAAVILLVAGGTLTWAGRLPIHRQIFRRLFVARQIGVTAAHGFDVAGWVRRQIRHRTVSGAEFERLRVWFAARSAERGPAGDTFAAAEGLNLVMIQAESLQGFVVSAEIGGQPVMPTLARWAADGLWFTEVTDQTGHGRSSDSELLTQTSLLPLADGSAAFAAAGDHFTSLAGELAERGYTTLSAVPFDGAFWNRAATHRAYGYATNLFAQDFGPGRRIGWGLGDRDFMSQMGDRLRDLPQPFCVWMITLSLHHPFEGFPDDLQELDVGHWEGQPVGEYLHTMHYLDHALSDLEAKLASAGLLDRTVIVVWGDHDAGFEWTPEVAALMGVTPDSLGWYRSQKVPLVIRTPAALHLQGEIATPAGHVDVAPTVAALIGLDSSRLAWMGRNLLGAPGDLPVVGEYGCWTTRDHLFLQGDEGTLEDGRCLDRTVLSARPAAECAEAFGAAVTRVDVAQEVLRGDLQARLTAALGGSP